MNNRISRAVGGGARLASPSRLVRAAGFWLAVLLPVAYVPIFTGLVTVDIAVFLSALTVNVVALLVGHAYEPGRDYSHGSPPGSSGQSGYQ